MFSILLKVKTCNSSDKWKYLCNDDGSIYQNDDLEQVRLKVIQLLKDHTLTDIKVVSNKRTIQHIVIEGNPDEPGVWLPEVTIDDNGKVLMVINGEWDKGTVEVGDVLPEVTTEDNGKVLMVVNGEWDKGEVDTTDEKVEQVAATNENAKLRVLLSNSFRDITEIEKVKKDGFFTYNPHDFEMEIAQPGYGLDEGGRIGFVSVNACGLGYLATNPTVRAMARFKINNQSSGAVTSGCDIQEVDSNNNTTNMAINSTNIILSGTNNTWDGTNTSLKQALTPISTETINTICV